MRNAKTRLLSLVLAVIMVVSMLPATVLATDGVTTAEDETPVIAQSDGITLVSAYTPKGAEAPTHQYGIVADETDATQYYVTTDGVADTATAYTQANATEKAASLALAAWKAAKSGTVDIYQSYEVTALTGPSSSGYYIAASDSTYKDLTLNLNGCEIKKNYDNTGSGFLQGNKAFTGTITVMNGTVTWTTSGRPMVVGGSSSSSAVFEGTFIFENLNLTQTASDKAVSMRGFGTVVVKGGTIKGAGIVLCNDYNYKSDTERAQIYLMDGAKIASTSAKSAAVSLSFPADLYMVNAVVENTSTAVTENGVAYGTNSTGSANCLKLSGTDYDGERFQTTVTSETGDTAIVSTYAPVPTYTVNIPAVEGGAVKADLTNAWAGDTVTLDAVAAEGFEFESLTVATATGTPVELVDNKFTMPAEDVVVTATFKALAAGIYNITVAETKNGTVTAPENEAVDEDVTLIIEPAAGYEVDTITVNGAAAEATFKMPAEAVEVVVTFKPANMKLAVEYKDANGTTSYYTADVADADYNTYTSVEAAFEAAYDKWVADGKGVDAAATPEIHVYQDLVVSKQYGTGVGAIQGSDNCKLLLNFHGNKVTKADPAADWGFIVVASGVADVEFTIEDAEFDWQTTASNRFFLQFGKAAAGDPSGTITFNNVNWTSNKDMVYYVCDVDIVLNGGTYNLGGKTLTYSVNKDGAGKDACYYLTGGVVINTTADHIVKLPAEGKLYIDGAVINTSSELDTIDSGLGLAKIVTSAEDNTLLTSGLTDHLILGSKDGSVEAARYGLLNAPTNYNDVTVYQRKIGYDPNGAYAIGVVLPENGTAVAPDFAYAEDEVTVEVTPVDGYVFDSLTLALESGEDWTDYIDGNIFAMPEEPVVVTVNFVPVAGNNPVTVTETENGTVTPDKFTASAGEDVALTIEPAQGYEVDSITVNGEVIEGTTFKMPDAEAIVTVTFKVVIGEPAVSYSDGTTTTNYYVAVADDVDRDAYDTMHKAVEAAFAQWAEVGSGTITLYQDWTIENIIDVMNPDDSQRICVGAGQSLTLELNKNTLDTENTSGKIFGLTGTAEAPAYLRVQNGTVISTYTSAGAILRVTSGYAGTAEFVNCDMTYDYSGSESRSALSVTSAAPVNVYLIGGTCQALNASVWLPTSDSSIGALYLQGGVQVYRNATTIGTLRAEGNGSLHFEDAVIYTLSENILSAGECTIPEGKMIVSATTTEDLPFVTGEPTDGTLYKHTVEAIPENVHKVIIGEVVNGTVTAPEFVAEGTDVTLTVEAAKGYELDTVFVDGVAIEGTTFTMPAADVTVTATFKLALGEPVVSYFDGTTTINYYVAEVEDVNQNAYLSVEDAFEAAYDLWDLTGGVDAPATPEIHLHQDLETTRRYDSSSSNTMQVGANSKLIIDLEGNTLSTKTNNGGFYYNNTVKDASLTIQNGTVNWGTSSRFFITGGANDGNFESNATITLKGLTFSSPTRPLSYLCNLNIILDGGTFNLGANAFNDLQSYDGGREGTGNVTLKNGVVINTTNSYAFRLPTDGHLYIEDAVVKTASNASTADEGYGIFVKVTSKTDATDLTSGLSNYVTLGNATNCSAVTTEAEGDAFKHTITLTENTHVAGEVVVENTVDATCSAAGSYDNVTYCTVCGHETSRETVVVEQLAHTEEAVEAKAPTCEEAGYTAGTKCSVCGVTLSGIEEIAAGHAWTVDYVWGENNATCTATRTCANDPAHVETAEAVITVEGDITTATFDVDWATTQTKGGEVVVPTYTITWVVEGVTVHTITDVEGTAVTAPEVEEREGYTFAWDQDITVIGTADVTVTGTYTEIPAATYTITWIVEGNVVATVTDVEGTAVTAPEVEAREGYTFAWDQDITVIGTADVTVTGTYTEIPVTTYTVTVNEATNGTVNATATGTVEAGTEITVTVAANEGYKLAALTVNGEAVTVTNGTYTFNVTADTTIAAEFKAIPVADLPAFVLGVQDQIILNFKLLIPDEILNDDNFTVKMTRLCDIAGYTEPVVMTAAEVRAAKEGERYVPTIGMPGPMMTIDVKLEIFDGNGEAVLIKDTKGDGSVKPYVIRAAQDYYKDMLSRSGPAYDTLKSLLVAMATYGGYAQTTLSNAYTDFDVANPAYNILPDYGKTLPDLSGITSANLTDRATLTGDAIGVTLKSDVPSLNAAVINQINFTLDQPVENYTVTYNYHEADGGFLVLKTREVTPTWDAANNRYFVVLPEIEACYWDYMYDVVFTEKETGKTCTISASVLAYCGRQFDRIPAYQNLFRAMYFYNQAAKTYFASIMK